MLQPEVGAEDSAVDAGDLLVAEVTVERQREELQLRVDGLPHEAELAEGGEGAEEGGQTPRTRRRATIESVTTTGTSTMRCMRRA